MNLPAAAHGPGSHHEYLMRALERLHEEYAELLKNPGPRRNRDAIDPDASPFSRRSRQRVARRRPAAARREPPVFRFNDPPLHHFRPQRRPRQSELARVFVLMLILHVVIIGGIVIGDMMDWTLTWKAVGFGVVAWVLFRVMATLSRRIHQGRRTTSRISSRNCDRDIFL